MVAKSVSRKVVYVLAAIAMAFAALLVWGTSQAHAASTAVAHVMNSGHIRGTFDDLQAAFDAVNDGEDVYLIKDVVTTKTYKINRGKRFDLRLNGHTITSNAMDTAPILLIENGNVTIRGGENWRKQPGIIGTYTARCIQLRSGHLNIWTSNDTVFRGGRVLDVYGGEVDIWGGTFENSIVIYDPSVKLNISGGKFEKRVSISAKGKNACTMEITGGEFLAKITNTGKTGFITGGKYHYLRMPSDNYIHPEYYKVEDSITREGRTETAYRIVKKPPSVAFTPESGTVEYDPVGAGTQITAKVVDSNGTTVLTPATFRWYKGDEQIGSDATVTLNEPGTYKAVATYKGTNYEAEYTVKPADISKGYTTSLPGEHVFTGFPYGSSSVTDSAKLFKEGSATAIDGFTYSVKSTGENIDAGTGKGTYTIAGLGKYAGELSGTFDIAKANFDNVEFTVSPPNPTYTGVEVRPTVTGTLTTDGRTYTLDPSEYTVTYSDNVIVGEATATITSTGKNFTTGSQTKSFMIAKAPNIVSVTMEGWESGEADKEPTVTADYGASSATFEYKAKGDTAYTTTKPSTPGTYTVRATIPASTNYEAGVATADFTIAPMPLTVASATAEPRTYEYGKTAVEISDITFTDKSGEPVSSLTEGTDYTVTGAMETADAGVDKVVTVTVQLKNSAYGFPTDGDTTTTTVNTTTTTVSISKAAAPTINNVRVMGYITYTDATDETPSTKAAYVNQSVADVMPADAGERVYVTGDPQAPAGIRVEDFGVSANGLVAATLLNVDNDKVVTLPVIIGSTNYEDATVNVVVALKDKTLRNVSLSEYDTSMEYGDAAFELTATATDVETGAVVETQDGDWWWYSSNPNVLEVAEQCGNPATVTVKGAGTAMIMAWYEPTDGLRQEIGELVTEPITVAKRPLTVTAPSQESIYVGGTLPGLPLTEDIRFNGLADGDIVNRVSLDYAPEPDSARPGTSAIVADEVLVKRDDDGADVSASYDIKYVNGEFTVKPKEPQTITAADVTVTYGDTGKSVSATTDGDGALSYAVTSGQDCVDVDAANGALTIKRAGEAIVTVTAAETTTYAETTKNVKVTVLKADPVPATVSDPENGWSYDGTERRLVVVEGEVTGGTMQYSLDGGNFLPSVPTATDAGEYTVWYKVKGDENHSDSAVQSLDVTVSQAFPVVDAPGPLSATCGDLLEDVELPTVGNGTWSWTEDPDRWVEHAGANNFEAMFTPSDTTNYAPIRGVLVVVNAAKGASSVTKAPAATNPSYNGELQALVTAGAAEGGAMVYSIDGEDFTEEIPTGIEAGDYTVWYMAAEDENYNESEVGQVTSKIAKASIAKAQVTLSQASYTYDGEAKEPAVKSVVLDGRTLAAGTDYDVSYANNTEVGTATVTVTGKGNYVGAATATFAINEKPNPAPDSGLTPAITPDLTPTPGPAPAAQKVMHRLYNQWSGEHFYTSDDDEYAGLVEMGWTDEGEGWKAPETSSTPVYRLYNPYVGEHHYSMDASERDALIEAGWEDEGVGWYSDDAKGTPLYREYNPYEFANNHNFTADVDEHENLVSLGWVDEGISWYGMAVVGDDATSADLTAASL